MTSSANTAPTQQLSPASGRRGGPWTSAAACCVAAALLLFVCEWANRGTAADAAQWLFTRLLAIRPLMPRLFGFAFILASLILAVQLTGRRWVGIAIGAIPWSLIALATSLKREITGDPLIPGDLVLPGATIGAAVEAVSIPLLPIALLIAAIVAAILAERRWPTPRRSWRFRAIVGFAALTISTLLCVSAGWLAEHRWMDLARLRAARRYADYGLAAGFVLDLRDLGRYSCAKPEGYSPQAIAAIAAEHPATTRPAQSTAVLPSIIIIQLESLLDPAQTHLLPPDVEVLPNLRSLHRQFGSIHAVSAIYGGRSANSEFEVNTGLSMTLLPEDSVAYEHILRRDIPSLARVLGDHGYGSTSIVCGYATMFRYNEVYPKHLGFGRVIFADELMPEASRYDVIPDAVVLDRVARVAEGASGPTYIFASTGHNHAPWTADRFPVRRFDAALPPDLPGREEFAGYLQGAYQCDAAVGEFIERIKKLDRPTIIFFYGDHHPGLTPQLLQRMGRISGATASTPAEILATHTTMAAFWTNVPDVRFPTGRIGLNYAGSAVLEAAGIEHPFYTGLLSDVRQHTRAVAPGLYLGIDGAPLPGPPAGARADLHRCELLQYDLLAGGQYSIGPLFAPLAPPRK